MWLLSWALGYKVSYILPKGACASYLVPSFFDAQQSLYKLPIRDAAEEQMNAAEEQMDSAPLAGRVSYVLVCQICLTVVSYCFGEFCLLPNEDRQG